MDCEGCEFPVLESVDISTLRKFDYLIIEYHGDPTPLAAKLAKAGFRVKVERPFTIVERKPIGLIYAMIKF